MTKKQLYKFIKRQIELSRFESHIRKDLLKRLDKLHRQVKGRIGEEDLENVGVRDLNRLISDVSALSVAAHKEIANKVDGYAIDLVNDETAFIYKEFGESWGVHKKAPKAFVPLVLGVTAEEWLEKQGRDYVHNVKMAVRNSDTIDHLRGRLGNQTKAFTTTWTSSVSQQTQDKIADKAKNVRGYWHVSVLDGRTSDICLVRSNKRWDRNKKPIDHDIPFKKTPLHPHCRSFLAPIKDVSKEPATMTVDDWLDSMSKDELDEVLGKGKAMMYRKGQITLRDLLDQSGRPQSLTDLQRKYEPYFIEPVVDTLVLRGVRFQPDILKRKIKHNETFGGNNVSQKAENIHKFQQSIIGHLNDEGTYQWGYYQQVKHSKVYYNKVTNVAVAVRDNNQFITTYKPSAKQLEIYFDTGKLR